MAAGLATEIGDVIKQRVRTALTGKYPEGSLEAQTQALQRQTLDRMLETGKQPPPPPPITPLQEIDLARQRAEQQRQQREADNRQTLNFGSQGATDLLTLQARKNAQELAQTQALEGSRLGNQKDYASFLTDQQLRMFTPLQETALKLQAGDRLQMQDTTQGIKDLYAKQLEDGKFMRDLSLVGGFGAAIASLFV